VSQVVMEETLDLAPLQQIIDEYKGQRGVLIQVLQRAQETYGYLPAEVLETISRGLGVPLSQVYGVVTFYSQFYLTRRGKQARGCAGEGARHRARTDDAGLSVHLRGRLLPWLLWPLAGGGGG
jgi:NADH:ubiquinone oxidoreductase subunit E